MAEVAAQGRIFFVPSPRLGKTDDVRPERITQAQNEWMEVSREVLAAKRKAAERGWQPTSEITDDHHFLHPFGGQYCPALQEVNQIGYVMKWPANAVLQSKGPRQWDLHVSEANTFYKYHGMSSFPEAGQSDVISVALGWIVVTPPGWSILIKNLPNNLSGAKHGMTFAEGVVRTDQATIPLQVHVYIPPTAPKEITLTRGQPMCIVMPFRRERLEMTVLDDADTREEAVKLAERDHETFANAPGRYKELFVEETNLSPLYPKLVERAEANDAKKAKSEAPS